MNRKEKIDAIYEQIADKTLSFGCKVKGEEAYYTILEVIPQPVNGVKRAEVMNGYRGYGKFGPVTLIPIKEYKIIGHPVMIGDVLEELYGDLRFSDLAGIWKELRKPIEEQSDECVDFVYDLIF